MRVIPGWTEGVQLIDIELISIRSGDTAEKMP